MNTIGNKTIEGASELVSGLLHTYRTELDKAYMKAEGTLSVSIGLTFKPAETLRNGYRGKDKVCHGPGQGQRGQGSG